MLIININKEKIISCWKFDPLKVGGETFGFTWSLVKKEQVEGYDVFDYFIQIKIKHTGGIIHQTFRDIKSDAELISTINSVLNIVDERHRKGLN